MVAVSLARGRDRIAGAALAVAVAAAAASAVLGTVPARAAASCSSGYVALTFDDGPGAASTGALLDVLDSAGVRATLFTIGQNAAANPALVTAEQAAGMWIGNHTYTHADLNSLSAADISSELARTQQAITAAGGSAPVIFRPPYGNHNATVDAVASGLGLTLVTWDVDTRDWSGVSTAEIVATASQVTAGGLILMHDGYQTTRDAVPQIVADLTARGLCAGRISPVTGRAVAPDGTGPTATTTSSSTTSSTTTTSGTTSTTPSTTTATTSGQGSCTAVYRQVGAWPGGFQGEVTVSAGAASLSGWSVTLTLGSGESISSLWNGTASAASGVVTVRNAAWNGSLAAGASTAFGFTATATGTITTPAVTCAVP